MGSSTGSKWIIMLVLYFGIMTLILTLISNVTPEIIDTGESGGYDISTNTSGVMCGLPRTTHEPWITDEGTQIVRSTRSDYTDESGTATRGGYDWIGNLECKYSRGMLGASSSDSSNDICDAIDGCSWEQGKILWIIPSGDYSCVGEFNHTWINETDTETHLGDLYISYLDDDGGVFVDRPVRGICGYAPVLDNQTRCLEMSCSWGVKINDIDYFTANQINDIDGFGQGKSLFGTTWDVVKDLVTFRFDFGFDNGSANFLLNLLIFWIPLIALILAIVQFIPFLG